MGVISIKVFQEAMAVMSALRMSVQSKKFKARTLGNADLQGCNKKSILDKYSISVERKKIKLREHSNKI